MKNIIKMISFFITICILISTITIVNAGYVTSTEYGLTKIVDKDITTGVGSYLGFMDTIKIGDKFYTYIATQGDNSTDSKIYVYDTTDANSYKLVQTITQYKWGTGTPANTKIYNQNISGIKCIEASDGTRYLLYQSLNVVLFATKINDDGTLATTDGAAIATYAAGITNRYHYRLDACGDYVFVGNNQEGKVAGATLVEVRKYDGSKADGTTKDFADKGKLITTATGDKANAIKVVPVYDSNNSLTGFNMFISATRTAKHYLESYIGAIAADGAVTFTLSWQKEISAAADYIISVDANTLIYTVGTSHYKVDLTNSTDPKITTAVSTGRFPAALTDGYYAASDTTTGNINLYSADGTTTSTAAFNSKNISAGDIRACDNRITAIDFMGNIAVFNYKTSTTEWVDEWPDPVPEDTTPFEYGLSVAGGGTLTIDNGQYLNSMDIVAIGDKLYMYAVTEEGATETFTNKNGVESTTKRSKMYVYDITDINNPECIQNFDNVNHDWNWGGYLASSKGNWESLKIYEVDKSTKFVIFQIQRKVVACPIRSNGTVNVDQCLDVLTLNDYHMFKMQIVGDYILINQGANTNGTGVYSVVTYNNGAFVEKGRIDGVSGDKFYSASAMPAFDSEGKLTSVKLYASTERKIDNVTKTYFEVYSGTKGENGNFVFTKDYSVDASEVCSYIYAGTNCVVFTTAYGVKYVLNTETKTVTKESIDTNDGYLTNGGTYLTDIGSGYYVTSFNGANKGQNVYLFNSNAEVIGAAYYTTSGSPIKELKIYDRKIYGITFDGKFAVFNYDDGITRNLPIDVILTESGNNITVNVSTSLDFGSEARAIVAFYDDENSLTFVKIIPISGIGNFSATMSKPSDAVYAKLFTVNSMANMRPICDYKIILGQREIVCWGDSLTAGGYPAHLEELAGVTVYNRGIGGENASSIAARQGGLPMLVKEFTIPAGKEAVAIELYANSNMPLNVIFQNPGDEQVGINTCYINGIAGRITKDSNGYKFTRSVAGETVAVAKGTPVMTASMIERRGDIAVIFSGENGGYCTPLGLNALHNSMINYLNYDNPQYIIVGLTHGTNATLANLDSFMEKEYGEHFFDLREYFGTNEAFEYAGITATDADKAAIAEGAVPPSFLQEDGIHFNEIGRKVQAKGIFEKLKSLAYIN